MKKLLKYTKPYLFSITCIFIFVFGQVQAELALPDAMSSIVSGGIQFGGISSSIPEAIDEETFNKLLLLSTEDQAQQLNKHYSLVPANTESYLSLYPANQKSAIFVATAPFDSEFETDMAKALLSIQALSNPEIATQLNLPGDIDIWTALQSQPDLLPITQSAIQKEFLTYSDDNLRSAGRLLTKQIYTNLGMNTDKIQSDFIYQRGVIMLFIALLGAVAAMISAYLASKVAAKIARDIRKDVFEKVESFSSDEFGKFSASSLITRTTNDVQQIQQVLTMIFRMVLFAPLMGIGAIGKVVKYPSMLWILGLIVAILLIVLLVSFLLALPKFKTIQKLIDRLNLVMREYLGGMLVIRAFNTQKQEEKRFSIANTDITKVNLFVSRLMSSLFPIMMLVMNVSTLLVVWYGTQQIDLGLMHVGEMMAFIQYSMQILMSFIMVSVIAIILPRSSVSATRIVEVLETQPSILDPKEALSLPLENQEISFNHVFFKYPKAEEYVLKDIHFTASPGETVAFIGSTGSGKSTLVNLLPRFFEITKGSITYGGINIQKFKQHDLRARIGYVPQKGVLFSGTIESNLLYADENASKDMIQTAINISQSKEFIDSKPLQIQSPIAQGGTNVSGGQKQRLSIARAITKNPDIYIFDDSFSALDYTTDAKLRHALNLFTKEAKKTVLIVAQRISSIIDADKIIVLDEGRMVGIGTHDTLLKNCKVYQEIASSQLSKEELEHDNQSK